VFDTTVEDDQGRRAAYIGVSYEMAAAGEPASLER